MPSIQQKRGTAAALTATNPVLLAGEICVETDTNKFKIGDGVTAWSGLSYVSSIIVSYATTANFPAAGTDNVVYVATDTGRMYRWASTVYVELGPNAASIGWNNTIRAIVFGS